MRVRLSDANLARLFLPLHKNYQEVAKHCRVSPRTLRDWRAGKFTIPLTSFEKLRNMADLDEKSLAPKLMSDFWFAKEAGRKGGVTRLLHGNFGTPEGRRKGGIASLATHKRNATKFWTLKTINKPEYSESLAELLGILFGDGHLSRYQVSVTTSSHTDREHAIFTRKLMERLFGIFVALSERVNENVMTVVASSTEMIKFLNQRGMPIGNKIQNKLSIPKWIKSDMAYQRAFIRGLFDTDGCIYVDTHKYHKHVYKHAGWTITSYAATLVADITDTLRSLEFSPTHRDSQMSVYLRRQKEIKKYFEEIGTNNPKHLKRYLDFQRQVRV